MLTAASHFLLASADQFTATDQHRLSVSQQRPFSASSSSHASLLPISPSIAARSPLFLPHHFILRRDYSRLNPHRVRATSFQIRPLTCIHQPRPLLGIRVSPLEQHPPSTSFNTSHVGHNAGQVGPSQRQLCLVETPLESQRSQEQIERNFQGLA